MTLAERWGLAPPRSRKRTAAAQRGLDEVVGWGGRRKGAGRPPSDRPNAPHARHREHKRHVPVHVTLRRTHGLPSLRSERLHNLLKDVIRATQREGFRIVHYSVQADHVHLIVEAESKAALSSAMRGFAIRASRRLNREGLHRRRGRVWGDRYHRHDLATPPEVRHALVYVLANGVKHREVEQGAIDPCSSARWFDGWVNLRASPAEPMPTQPPATWLLREGWTRVYPGYLYPSEVPKAARAGRR
jgi:REP element-mobilizing transposase RayT